MHQVTWHARKKLSPGLKLPGHPADYPTMDMTAIALQGLEQADAMLEQAAARIASAGAISGDTPAPDAVSLSSEIVALLPAKNDYSLNLAILKTADSLQQKVLDIQA